MTKRSIFRVAVPLALIAALGAWYYPFTLYSPSVGFLADDAIYLLMADALSPFHYGETRLLDYVMRITLFPPLYPLVLGWLGGGSADLVQSHLITTTLYLGALAAFYFLAWRISRQVGVALLSLVVVAVLPISLYMATEFWSEFQYMLLCFFALTLAGGVQRSDRVWWLIAALVGLAAYTRSAGISLILAFGLFTLLKRPAHRIWLWVLAAGPLLLWELRGLAIVERVSYLNALGSRVAAEDRDGFFSGVAEMGRELWWGWVRMFDPSGAAIAIAVCAAVLILACGGLAMRLRRGELDALYVVTYLGLVLVWPYPSVAARLLYPVAPLVVLYAALGAQHLSRGARGIMPTFGGYLPMFFLLFLTLPYTATIAHLYLDPADPQVGDYRSTRYWLRNSDKQDALKDVQTKQSMVAAMRRVRDLVSESDCVYSWYMQATMFYSRRVSLPPDTKLPSGETCRYYLLLSTSHIQSQLRRLGDGYRVVYIERPEYDPQAIAAILVEYSSPDLGSGEYPE